MPTLLLQCVGPLQAWDTQSNFGVRTTGREPSKSGITGLLCAALGRARTEPVADLAALRMGVRREDRRHVGRQDVCLAGGGKFPVQGYDGTGRSCQESVYRDNRNAQLGSSYRASSIKAEPSKP